MSEETTNELSRLEEEGELAADYLEELLGIADLDEGIDSDVEALTDRPDRILGPGREHFVQDPHAQALQELTRLAVQTETGERSRLMLDIAGFRADRKADLQDLTHEAIARLRATGEPQKLEPMNPFERKVCHDVVASEGLRSESEGVEPRRRVVILPAEDTDADTDSADEAEEA